MEIIKNKMNALTREDEDWYDCFVHNANEGPAYVCETGGQVFPLVRAQAGRDAAGAARFRSPVLGTLVS